MSRTGAFSPACQLSQPGRNSARPMARGCIAELRLCLSRSRNGKRTHSVHKAQATSRQATSQPWQFDHFRIVAGGRPSIPSTPSLSNPVSSFLEGTFDSRWRLHRRIRANASTRARVASERVAVWIADC